VSPGQPLNRVGPTGRTGWSFGLVEQADQLGARHQLGRLHRHRHRYVLLVPPGPGLVRDHCVVGAGVRGVMRRRSGGWAVVMRGQDAGHTWLPRSRVKRSCCEPEERRSPTERCRSEFAAIRCVVRVWPSSSHCGLSSQCRTSWPPFSSQRQRLAGASALALRLSRAP
jgi:hypothetical protein